MGEVFRARDRRLDREVAVKVLPEQFSKDPSALARFEREAKAVAALSHPNIMAIFDFGQDGETAYAAMELLEGETLREKLSAPLPLKKAVDWSLQMAQGLAAAHEKGIVHRDLKPENLFVTREGRVKILDFGLAKVSPPSAASGASHDAPTAAVHTEAGTILGTAGYMSPEQVRGQAVDHRSDLFSFGAILYEMLTGHRAFKGPSAVDTLSAILKEEPPDLAETAPALPPGLGRIVNRCLEKRPEERFQSAKDLQFALEGLSASGPSLVRPAVVDVSPRAMPRRWLLPLAIGALAGLWLGGAAVSVIARRWSRASQPKFRQISFGRGTVYTARFSPDGETVIYSAVWEGGNRELFTTLPGCSDSRPLGLANADVAGVSNSGEIAVLHDRSSGFASAKLAKVPLAGGPPRDVREGVAWADWRKDGSEFLVAVSEGGNTRLEYPIGKVLYESSSSIVYPRISPDGRSVAFLEYTNPASDAGLVAVVNKEGKRKVLSQGWASIEGLAWAPGGREVWFTAAKEGLSSSLWAVSLRGKLRLLLRSPGRLVLHDAGPGGRVVAERNQFRASISGIAPGQTRERDLSWLDFSGLADLSPDGQTFLFFESGEGAGKKYPLYIRKTDGSVPVRLGEGRAVGLSPDGKWVAALPEDGTPKLLLLPTGAGESRGISLPSLQSVQWADWFPDGQRFLLLGKEQGKDSRLFVLESGGGAPRPISPEGVNVRSNTISPDGAWVAAQRDQMAVLFPVAGGEPRTVLGADPGDIPLAWTPDGRSLWMRNHGSMPVAGYLLDPATGVRKPWREFMPPDPSGVLSLRKILVTPDGRTYLYNYFRLLSDLYVIEGIR